jgi:hypothetical protein
VGKSVFARNLAAKTQVSCLFFSADSDEYTVKTSVTGALTGQKMVDIALKSEDEAWDRYFTEALRSTDHVDWCYNPDINLDFLTTRLQAYAEMYGEFPKLVVVDNLGDLVTEDGEEYAELRAICRELRKLARYSNSHILALHHAKGAWEDGRKPITLGALLGNLGKVPENVLGLHWEREGVVHLTVPKARGSRRGMNIPLGIDYETARLDGFY